MNIDYIISQAPAFTSAMQMTIAIALLSMVIALAWGLIVVALRMSPRLIVRGPAVAYIELMRNTPLLLQVYVIYFGLPLAGLLLSGFMCGVIAVASQHGAFLAEIYRGGIESISDRQREAGKALGMTRLKVMRYVVLPQALVNISPAISNQLVILLKDTAVVSAIGVLELTLTAKLTIERSAASVEIFILIAVLYLILTSLLGIVVRVLESWQRARL